MVEILERGQAVSMERKITDVQRIVNAYKEAKGVGIQDKMWDRYNFARCSKPAKSLLDCLGSWEKAAAYILGKGQEFDDIGFSWTLETIARHAWDDRGKLIERTPEQMGNPELLTGGRLELPAPGRKPGISSAGALADNTLDRLRRDIDEKWIDPLLASEDVGGPEGDGDA